ncbi:exocyst complex component 7 isoform X1 [Octopus bimaculoides]|uniref:exocyst complex component 7 isoform X1 n=1 Tax=Octopus bimaculoides TaxID=37653 RepID=UPI00071CA164|nr:exocyst complex component 7 isoform X1 [Octopus bimaculoides]|eukprot:XP_014786307.1 PREDICTED: exocyst complex component 7-like isoform X1 [Octopus bimaculoides]
MDMDDISVLKADIDRKLEKEMYNLSVLKESLNKSNTNTQNMLAILNSFETRLCKLENTILPVYQETENLRRRQENIDKTMSTLDNVLGYYHIAKDLEFAIKEGPIASGLEKYLEHMESVLKAVRYFKDHNPGSLELTEVVQLFEDGKEVLGKEFESQLSRYGKPVPPILILDMLGTDEELQSGNGEPDILEHLPEKVAKELGDISRWLVTNGNTTNFLNVYTSSRSDILVRSLHGLKEHLKSASGSSNCGYTQHSPALTGKIRPTKEMTPWKALKFPGYLKKASTSLIKSSFESGHRRTGSSTEGVKEDPAEIEVEFYITEMTALLKLMQSEAQLMNGIIPEKYQRMEFDKVILRALEMVVSEGEAIATNAKKNIARHEYTSVLSIFPIVQHLRCIKPQFDLTLEGCQAPTRSKLASLLSVLDSTGAKALDDFIENIKIDPEKVSNMPKDGTVHELTNHTIIFLVQLKEYAETAGAMLMKYGVSTVVFSFTVSFLATDPSAPSVGKDTEKSKLKLADYITKVLSELGLNLTNKSETYSDQTLKYIFLLNNYNYIIKSLKTSGLLDFIHLWNKDVGTFYDNNITEQKKNYSQSWSRVLHYILEVHKPISVQRAQQPELAKLKDKERQNIKDKFTGFNKELEEIYRIQKSYAIPDLDLRQSLKKENKDYILPMYQMFRDKYTQLNFTKNPDKYIKYSVEDVGKMIDKFFDASA